jgi:hypothetical protein
MTDLGTVLARIAKERGWFIHFIVNERAEVEGVVMGPRAVVDKLTDVPALVQEPRLELLK